MSRLLKSIFLISLLLFFCSIFVFAEDITITTYYPSPYGSYKNLNIYNQDDSTTQADFTQDVKKAGLLITTDYTDTAFTPGIFWSTTNNNPTKPKAGIYLKETAQGTKMFFGTSNNYATGITNDALVIGPTGNVGIGTTGPTSLLHVKQPSGNLVTRFEGSSNGYSSKMYISSASSGDGGMLYDASANTLTIFSYGDVIFDIGTANISGALGNERMRITQGGNVGIGIVNPTERLQVFANSGSISLSNALPGYAVGSYSVLKSSGTYMYFSTNGVYSAYMDSGGVLHANSSRNRKENFSSLNAQDILVKIEQLPVLEWNYKDQNPSIKHIGPFAEDFHRIFGLGGDDDKTIGNIDPPGVALIGIKALLVKVKIQQQQIESLQKWVQNYSAPGITPSDSRIKKDIRSYTNGLSIIKRINPVWFKYNGKAGFPDDNQNHIGIIAQEIAKVAPYTVNTFSAKLNPQDKEESKLLNFNSHALTFDLINAAKELDNNITKLSQENQDLKKGNQELKSEVENLKIRLNRLEIRTK